MKQVDNYELENFELLANNLNLFQGSGGNFSYKNANKIYITPSGYSVSKCITDKIFLEFITDDIVNLVINKKEIEQKDETYRPSIETYFHALIPGKYVFHFHPINLLSDLCSKQFFAQQNTIFSLIDYFKPGLDLSIEINNLQYLDKIILLKNHGVIISGDTFEQVNHSIEKLFNYFNKPIIQSFNIKRNLYTRELINDFDFYQNLINRKVFFTPDQCVFLNKIDISSKFLDTNKISFNLNENKNLNLLTYIELLESISVSDIDPLTNLEIKKLITWESEEYRLGIKDD